ncbi:hypothetical protein [Specibacter sp. RAF43]|uniref:hypothetical protein n=1 Tax=Specibacter sp. RAF43 TaxID=3233057 RepID=UPI003F9D27AF
MPLWLLITIIVVVWLLAMVGIIMFMMGASRGRERERLAEQRRNLEPAHQKHRHEEP